MSKQIFLADKLSCTGCSLCIDICKQGAISMTYDNSIHAYPIIDATKCIECGQCMQLCPSLKANMRSINNTFTQMYYSSWNTSLNDRFISTSGGTGTALMDYAYSKGYYVCASLFDDSWRLSHRVSKNPEDLMQLRGSKYLRSETIGVYNEIIRLLQQGEKLFFVGTPCQIQAVNTLIKGKFENQVITCAIICHGINSELVWKDYVDDIQRRANSSLLYYNFRSKSRGWEAKGGKISLRVAYGFQTGAKIDVPAWNNQFHTWFGQHLILRPSCLRCQYRQEERLSDITIGDFWNIEKILPNISIKEGVTALIVSSEKGKVFIEQCPTIFKEEVEAKDAILVLKGYIDNTPEEKRQQELKNNAEFDAEYVRVGFRKMSKKYPKQSYIQYCLSAIKSRLI